MKNAYKAIFTASISRSALCNLIKVVFIAPGQSFALNFLHVKLKYIISWMQLSTCNEKNIKMK
jgi:hypothetical protein